MNRLVTWVVGLPRLARMGLVFVIALAVTLVAVPVVDGVYLSTSYTGEASMVPAMVLAVIGFGVYALGWWLIIGYAGETPTPRPAILWYVMGGFAALIAALVLTVVGAISGAL